MVGLGLPSAIIDKSHTPSSHPRWWRPAVKLNAVPDGRSLGALALGALGGNGTLNRRSANVTARASRKRTQRISSTSHPFGSRVAGHASDVVVYLACGYRRLAGGDVGAVVLVRAVPMIRLRRS